MWLLLGFVVHHVYSAMLTSLVEKQRDDGLDLLRLQVGASASSPRTTRRSRERHGFDAPRPRARQSAVRRRRRGRRRGRAPARAVRAAPAGVLVLDGGTLGLSLLPYLQQARTRDPRRRHRAPTRRPARSCVSPATTSRPRRRIACRRTRSASPTCSTARACSAATRRPRDRRRRAGGDSSSRRRTPAVEARIDELVEARVDEAARLGHAFTRGRATWTSRHGGSR